MVTRNDLGNIRIINDVYKGIVIGQLLKVVSVVMFGFTEGMLGIHMT